MNSHIKISANNTNLALTDDFSISIEDRNPLWNDTEMFSLPVQIPLEGNRTLVRNIEDINSDMRPIDIENIPVRISVDGIPFRSGTAVITENEELIDSMSMNVNGAESSLQEIIGDMKCSDVAVDDDIQIGEKIGSVYVDAQIRQKYVLQSTGGVRSEDYIDRRETFVIEPQALGFSYPAICVEDSAHKAVVEKQQSCAGRDINVPKVQTSFINTSAPFGYTDPAGRRAVYCNARICYKHYNVDDEGNTTDTIVPEIDSNTSPEDIYPYWVLDANRQQSGICFYVLYFLERLFKQLGFEYDQSALMAVEDLRHLCFFTTKCKYTTRPAYHSSGGHGVKPMLSEQQIKDWLESRGCGGSISVEAGETRSIASYVIEHDIAFFTSSGQVSTSKVVPAGSLVKAVGGNAVNIFHQNSAPYEFVSIETRCEHLDYKYQAEIHNMYATSENLPDESVSDVLSALENQFGIRFYVDYQLKKVTAYFLRDVYRSSKAPREFHCTVLEAHKVSEKVLGVRNKYSAETTDKEQQEFVRKLVRDYDTTFNYIEYPKNRTITDKTYQQIIQNISATDMNVYIDLITGNAYRIKIDGEAKDVASLHPVIFEVGGMKGVSYGDCSQKNEDYITEMVINFVPVGLNDVNFANEKKDYSAQPILTAYIDEDMEHEFVKQQLISLVTVNQLEYKTIQTFYEKESYDPTKTSDGSSPLQNYDWGLSVAMMRGGGSDATMDIYDNGYDGFNNSRWRTKAGQYALSTDSIDNQGNVYDYNGTQQGIGSGERFSLKIRAYKQPEWADAPLCNAAVARRGTFDTFLVEHAHFLLNRKKYLVRCLASVAQIADIPNHWFDWWLINGKRCLINKVNTDISVKDGMGIVELEVYSL